MSESNLPPNEADCRRDEALKRMLKTPPQPHNAKKKAKPKHDRS